MHYLFYVTKYIHVIHTLASHLRNQQGKWGQSGVDVSKPAGYAVCDGNMSSYPAGTAAGYCFLLVSSFFLYPAGGPAGSCILLVSSFFFFFLLLLSSGNTSFSHTFLHLILTKLAHSDWYLNHYSHTKDGGVRGHYGVTGVKKVIFTKKASSPSDYVASMRDLCICISLTPSTKVMVLKIN